MKLSFIVPIYNAEKYLCECIESIIKIQDRNIEILLIDDGSTDRSGDICDEYRIKDDRVVVYHKVNEGVSCARNLGIEKASGDWICFIDADDFLLDSFEEKIIASLDEQFDLFFFYYLNDMNRQVLENKEYVFNEEEIHAIKVGILNQDAGIFERFAFDGMNYIGPWGCLYKKSLLKNIEFPKGIIWAEDRIFKLKVLQNVKKCKILGVSGYYYRQHNESVSYKYNRYIMDNIIQMFLLVQGIVEKEHNKEYTEAFYLFIIREYINSMAKGVFHKDSTSKLKESLVELKKWRDYPVISESFSKADLNGFRKKSLRISAKCLKNKWYICTALIYRIRKLLK